MCKACEVEHGIACYKIRRLVGLGPVNEEDRG